MNGPDWSQLFGSTLAPLGFGGVAGAIVGYTAKKLTKLVALGLGLLFIAVQLLVHYGLIEVHWTPCNTRPSRRGPTNAA